MKFNATRRISRRGLSDPLWSMKIWAYPAIYTLIGRQLTVPTCELIVLYSNIDLYGRIYIPRNEKRNKLIP